MNAQEWIRSQQQHEQDNPQDCIPVQECECPPIEEGMCI